jgi:pimeloyl-ACP methyl ester carboxylesterase
MLLITLVNLLLFIISITVSYLIPSTPDSQHLVYPKSFIMSPIKPAIVIVPGSFSPASLYAVTVEKLGAAGYPIVEVASYPSIGRRDPEPPATMYDDAEFIHDATEKLVSGGHDVLIVAHSYGGVPTSEALKGLTKSQRLSEGKKGGVVRVLYVAALIPRLGESLGSLMSAEPASYVNVAVSIS